MVVGIALVSLYFSSLGRGRGRAYHVSDPVLLKRVIPAPTCDRRRLGAASVETFIVGRRAAPVVTDLSAGAAATIELAPGATSAIELAYRSRGLDDWRYSFGDGVTQVPDFTPVAHTDFAEIDYPIGTMSPTTRVREHDGWKLTWRFDTLVTGRRSASTHLRGATQDRSRRRSMATRASQSPAAPSSRWSC